MVNDNTLFPPASLLRYSRQIVLPQVGEKGQKKLSQSKVLMIGLGGLGSPASLYLTAAGIGTIGLAEWDCVEIHNLQRQVLYDDEGVGFPKVKKACEKLKSLNPDLILHQHPQGVQVENAIELFGQYDLIIDGSDNFPTRYLVNDAAFFSNKPVIYGSIFQFEAQVSVFHPQRQGPCYRCLFPEMPVPGTVQACEEAGVFGALCGIVGSIQAMEAIKYILGIGQPLLGKLFVIEALDMYIRPVQIKKDDECPLCGTRPKIKEVKKEHYYFPCNKEKKVEEERPIEIDINQAKQWLDKEDNIYLLDVREPFEVNICKIQDSINIPIKALSEEIAALPQDQPILIYCHHGGRSLKAAQLLRAKGFSKATHMLGGIHEWAKRFDPDMAQY